MRAKPAAGQERTSTLADHYTGQSTDISAAVRSFDAAPYRHLKHVEVWLPQLANRTYLEMEQE